MPSIRQTQNSEDNIELGMGGHDLCGVVLHGMAVFFEEPGITRGNVYPTVLDVPFKGDFPLPRLNAGKGKSVNTVISPVDVWVSHFQTENQLNQLMYMAQACVF